MAVSFDSLACGQDSGIEEAMRLVVTSKKDFEELWARHAAISEPPDPLPDVDFESDLVLCVFMGCQGSGGYGIRVVAVEDSEHQRSVTVESSRPPAGAMTTCALTQPHHVVRMARTPLAIRFLEAQEAVPVASEKTFLLTVEAAGAAERVRPLPQVTEVLERFSGAVLVVTMDVRSTTVAEAQKSLEALEGVSSVEVDG